MSCAAALERHTVAPVPYLKAALQPSIAYVESVKGPSRAPANNFASHSTGWNASTGENPLSPRMYHAGPQNQAIPIHPQSSRTTALTSQLHVASYTAEGLSGPGRTICTDDAGDDGGAEACGGEVRGGKAGGGEARWRTSAPADCRCPCRLPRRWPPRLFLFC